MEAGTNASALSPRAIKTAAALCALLHGAQAAHVVMTTGLEPFGICQRQCDSCHRKAKILPAGMEMEASINEDGTIIYRFFAWIFQVEA
jgi:hypothetical protein